MTWLHRTTCLYCDRRIPIEEHQRHRFEKHFDLQFKCSPCIEMLSTLHQGHFPSLDQLKKHLAEVHGEAEVDNEDKLQELIRSGMIILPSDLRSLDCRFCEGKKILLGQDRMAMAIHIRHRHNMKIPRHVFKYQCRMCHEEFKTSENLLSEEHQCQQLLAQFQESARSNTIGMEERGEESEIAGPSSSSVSMSNGELCHYCPTEYPVENKASHRGKHLDLDFLCGKCTRSFPYLEDIKHHLSKDHELVVEADDGVDGKHLADNGWLVMPKDLRVIQCPECQQPFLAQDRQTVLSHLKRMHGKVVGGQEKGLINYGCRSCNKTDFSNSAEVFEHDCLPKSKYDRNAIGGEQLALRSSEELLPLTDLEWTITEDMQVPNDLRRMACRLCGFQVNGQRFFKMVHHLEEKHDKYQQCRAYKLDFFVKFGCGHCPQFQCESVHTWDKHFQDDYCTKCAGMSSSDDAILACSDNVTNGVDATVAEKKNKVIPNDIRLLICKICSATFPKRGFEDIQAHLKLEHTQEIVDSPKLSDFVDFGCIKCPKYSPQSLVEWKDHFHLRNTTCNESHAALVAAANLSNLELDCRRLACKMCNFVVSDYYVLCKHLETQHNIDTKPSANFNFKEVFDFQCHRCPNFKPEDKHRWDRHFSSDNQFCQGSGKVQVLLGGKSRVLYWCDACQETRENIQAHFTGSSHRAAIEALLLSNSITNNIIRCDPCSISFTSQGNFDLHLEGDYHREKQIEASNSDTIKSTSASSTIIDDDVIVNNAAVCI